MNKESKELCYFKSSIHFLCTNQLIISILLVIEYLDIFSFLTSSLTKINHSIETPYNDSNSFTFYLSIYNIFKKNFFQSVSLCTNTFLLILSFLFLWYYIHIFCVQQIPLNNIVFQVICRIHVNFYELFFFRTLYLYFIDADVTFIVGGIYYSLTLQNESKILLYVELTLGIIMFFVLMITAFVHIRNHCVLTNYNIFSNNSKTIKEYPFDIHVSYPFDTFFLIIKAFISIEKNVMLFSGNYINDRIILFNVIGLMLFIIYFIYVLYTQFIDKVSSLFYRNIKTSMLRFVLINTTGFCIIIRLFLKESLTYIIIFIDFLCCLFFTFFYFKLFDSILLCRFYNCDNLIAVLYFVINYNSSKIQRDHYIKTWFVYHTMKCNKQNCIICDMVDIKYKKEQMYLFKYETFFHFLYECIKIDTLKHKALYSKNIEMYIDILDFVDLYLNGNNQKINFYICAYAKMKKYNFYYKVIHFNFAIMFAEINELNLDFIKSYNSFNAFEEILTIYNKFIVDIETFIKYENKLYVNIMNFSDKLFMFVNNKNVLSYLTKTSHNYSYELIILKYLYETLTHKILNKNSFPFDITQFTDFLSFHWQNDKFMLINYGLLENDCTIIRSSSSIKKMNGVPFEDLFPKYLRSNGKNILINELHRNNFDDNNNNFEFIINNQNKNNTNNNSFIESFKMSFIMYPSINTGKILIIGNYNYKYIDVLLFEIIDNKEILISFSENFSFIFNITPIILKELRSYYKVFEFQQLLIKKDSAPAKNVATLLKDNKPSSSSKIKSIAKAIHVMQNLNSFYYSFNYEQYLMLLQQYLTDINSNEISTNEIIHSLTKSKKSINNKIFKVNKTINITTKSLQFKAYFISIQKDIQKAVEIKSVRLSINDKTIKESNTSRFLSQTEVVSKTKTFAQTVCSSEINTSNTSDSLINQFNFKINKNDKEKKVMKKISSYICILISIHCFTIIIGIVYLLLELILINSFEDLFNLFRNFKYFKRGIDIELLRISSNFCFSPSIDTNMITNKTCINFFSEYSTKLKTQNSFMQNDIPINELIHSQFKANVLDIKQKYNSFIKGLYILPKKYIRQIEAKEITFLTLRLTLENKRKLIIKNETFFNSVNIFFNYFVELMNKDTVITTPMKLITLIYDNESNNYEIKYTNLLDITEEHKILYSIILNFPFITKLLLNIQSDIQEWFTRYLNNIKLGSIIFIICLLLLNAFLLSSKLLFIIYFSNKLNAKIHKIHTLLFSPMFVKFYLNKIALAKILLSLYDENPIDLAYKIDNENHIYKKQLNEIKKLELKSNENMPKQKTKSFLCFKFKIYNNKQFNVQNSETKSIFNFYLIFIFVIYVIFITIFLVLFIIIYNNTNKLNDVVNYSNLNSDIDNNLNSNINGIQFMLITNTTDNQLGGFINNNFSYNFVREGIGNHLHAIQKMENIKNKYTYLFTNEITKENRTCDELPAFNDTEFVKIIEAGKENFYNKCLINVCKAFGIMNNNNPTLLMENIIYYEQKILNNMMLSNYDLKLRALQMPELYQLFGLILILNRIQRNYLNEETLPIIIRTIIMEYKIIFIICLIINVLLLIIVAFITIVFVTQQLAIINKKLNLLFDFFQ